MRGYILNEFTRLAACRAVTDGDSFNLIVADHVEHMHLCLHDSVDGRVGEDGLVVEQVALGVEAHHLTTGAESGVDAHHAFLSERCIH